MTESELREQQALWREKIHALEGEIGKVLVGQHDVVRSAMTAMIAGGHVLFEGVPGLGKTLLVRTLARTVSGSFSRIQFTPDLMPADITGTNILAANESGVKSFSFQRGPLFANVVLADEINRATPKTQSALLEAMQEHSVTLCGVTHKLEGMFFVLATQNPIEMEGTYPLPEAQLDRFFCKIAVSYPSSEEMIEILDKSSDRDSALVQPVLSPEDIFQMRQNAQSIPIAPELTAYIVELVKNTHPEFSAHESIKKYVRCGASPRAAQALLTSAKISAMLAGRYNVSRADIQKSAPMILRHRIILSFEGQAENIAPDDLVAELIRA